MAARFSDPGQPFHGYAERTKSGGRWTGKVGLVPHRLAEPLRMRKPKRIFVCANSDLFHEALSDTERDEILAVMLLSPRHTFQVLTKRAARMRAYFAAPDLYDRVLAAANRFRVALHIPATVGISNPATFPARWIWLGVSVEDQATADARIPELLACPAAVHWASYEPAIGPVNLTSFLRTTLRGSSRLGWVVVGGESGPHARPCDVAWIRETVRQCREAGTRCFVKQLGACASDPPNGLAGAGLRVHPDAAALVSRRLRDRAGADPAEWPADLRVREYPEVP